MLGQKLKPESIDTAVSVATQRARTQTTIRDFFEFFVKIRLFTWEQIKSLVHNQIVLTLEQVLYPTLGSWALTLQISLVLVAVWNYLS